MNTTIEMLRGCRPDHCDYIQRLAGEYVERRMGHPWDEPVRPIR